MIHPNVETLLDELNHTGWNKIKVIHCFGIITNGGWITHDNEDVANTERMRGQKVPLPTKQISSAGWKMKGGLHSDLALHHITHCPSRHPHTCHRTIGHVDHVGTRI